MAAEKDNVDVQRLERKISEIEKILEESKPSKLKKGMILVEIDLIFEKLEELKSMIPDQIKLANNVLSKREKLLKSAEAFAHDKIDKANAKSVNITTSEDDFFGKWEVAASKGIFSTIIWVAKYFTIYQQVTADR